MLQRIATSRPLTDGEKNRLEELRQAYLEEGYFPKKELVMLDSPEKYKKGVAFYAARSIFFLPEEEVTDEELLELIDFREKRDYNCEINRRDRGGRRMNM